ncbi:OmpA family protein [Rhodocytophaga rosea]|uniref:OmpA family protein n=1 Tax=Rhodocytophaga rosea TaxID=2704465 RepID=A0A6C0GWR1_9BACT|nr:OmpA family protein [Rhodocytophaga rosea]
MSKPLLEKRAKSVVNYLISKGISQNRLFLKGYGENKPIDTNKSEAGIANNRRVEFTIR